MGQPRDQRGVSVRAGPESKKGRSTSRGFFSEFLIFPGFLEFLIFLFSLFSFFFDTHVSYPFPFIYRKTSLSVTPPPVFTTKHIRPPHSSIMSSNWLKLLQKQKQKQKQQEQKQPAAKDDVSSHRHSKSAAAGCSSRKSQGRKAPKSVVTMRTPLTKIARDQAEAKVEAAHKAQALRKALVLSQPLSDRQQEVGKYLAMDCEFVGVGPGGVQSELARVSIVNFHGHVIYDEYVRPKEKVTDWRTFVSGIRPSDMHKAITFDQAQRDVAQLLKDKVLVGHAIHHDLEALYLTHPKHSIRDTAKHTPFKTKYSKGKTPGLKKLAQEILGLDIQSGEHSSVEDARATMLIYKSDRKSFEEKVRPTYHNK